MANKAEGGSMEPTIDDAGTVIVDKLFYKIFGLKNGDIIIAESPVKPGLDICKRVLYQ